MWNNRVFFGAVVDGGYLQKTSVVSSLVIYYLLMLAVQVIQICFWIDQKLFEGLCSLVYHL